MSAAVIKGGDDGTDQFIARQAWLYVAILGAGYFVSRGLAKSARPTPTPTTTTSRKALLGGPRPSSLSRDACPPPWR